MKVNRFPSRQYFKVCLAVLLGAVVVGTADSARAASGNWNTTAGGLWSTPSNWSPAAVPGTASDDVVGLTFNLVNNRIITNDSVVILGTLNIGDTDNNRGYVLTNNSSSGSLTFSVTSGNAHLNQVSGSKGDTIKADLQLNNSLDIANASTNILTLDTLGSITASSAGLKTISNVGTGSNVVIASVIGDGSGTVAVVQNSATSTLTLNGVNTHTGGTTLTAGILNTKGVSTKPFGTGTLALNGGEVQFITIGVSTGVRQYSNNVTVGGNVIMTSDDARPTPAPGNYVFDGLMIGGQTLTVQPGAGITASNGIASVQFSGAITLTGNSTFTANNGTVATGQLTLGATGTLLDNGGFTPIFDGTGSNVVSAVMSGSGGFTKSGAGVLFLNGANTFTGNVTLNSGKLKVANTVTTMLGTGAAILTLNGGELWLASNNPRNFGRNTTVAGNATISSDDSVAGGAGYTYTFGTLGIGAQTLTIQAGPNGPASSTAGITFGATTLTGASTFLVNSNGLGAATLFTLGMVDNGGFTPIFDGTGNTTLSGVVSGSGGLTKAGAGTLTLSAANTFSGTTRIGAGTLTLGNANSLAGSTLDLNVADSGTLSFGTLGNPIFGGLSGARDLELMNTTPAAVSLTVGGNNESTTYSGILSGGGGLTKAGTGTLTLSGANTYTTATTINAGTLTLSGNRTAAAGAINVNGGTLNIQNGNFSLGSTALVVGKNGNNATVNHTAGTISFGGTGNTVLIGSSGQAGFTATYNLSGGTLNAVGGVNRGVTLGVNEGVDGNPQTAIFNLSGTGILNCTPALMIGRRDIASGSYVNATFSQTGGSATINSLSLGGIAAGSSNINATLSLTGGSFYATNFAGIGPADTNISTIIIGGTADVTLPAFPTARGVGSSATIAFDGGTLRPTAASTTYLSNFVTATITANGANFDVPSGRDITVGQAFANAPAQAGVITKAGAGALSLISASTFSGGVTNTAGTLKVGNAAALGTGTLFLNGGAMGTTAGTTLTNPVVLLADAEIANVQSLAFSGVISGSKAIFHSVGGGLTLDGTNTYSGGTTNMVGNLQVGTAQALGTGPLTMLGGSLVNRAFGTAITNDIVLAGSAAVGDTRSMILSGVISGTGMLTNADTATLTLSGANTYSGGTLMTNGGTLNLNHPTALGTGAFTFSAGISNVVLNNTSGADLTLANNNIQNWGSSFIFTGTTNLNLGAGSVTLGAPVTVTASASILTVGGGIGDGGNSYDLNKSGAGKLVLSGLNTYIGNTTVSNGTLVLNQTNYTPLVTVKSAATLGGNGFLRSVAVEGGGILAAGASIGKLSLTNLTLAATATNLVEFDVAGNTNDIVDVGGDLNAGGSKIVLSVANGNLDTGYYRLFNYVSKTGSFDTNVIVVSGSVTGHKIIDESVANQVNLLVTNNAPVANTDNLAWGKGASNKYISIAGLLANDTDLDGDAPVLVSVDTTSANGVPLTTNATDIQYTTALNADDSFHYTISDGFGGTATGLVSITATNSVGQAGEIATTPTNATAIFFGVPGTNYYVMRATNVLFTLGISNFPSGPAATNGIIQVVDDFADLPSVPASAFYRLVVP